MRTLVVLPTYNEIANVEKMLRALRSVVPFCDVLVVDDGSPDGTADGDWRPQHTVTKTE